MEKKKRERLLAAGWKVSTAAEFLELSPEEEALVEARIALTRRIRSVREEKGMTQVQVARLIGSSQSRVAKMEAADRTVSIDMMMRTLFRLGQTPRQVGRALAG
ncbi:MAG TPA: helix-turn-helix transcriptional regulator [Thermoanaerobaculia bacterium]|nr:helix-turn-helix transcriptional regulator [Thermoanaerobaculia bacterium]